MLYAKLVASEQYNKIPNFKHDEIVISHLNGWISACAGMAWSIFIWY